MIERISIPSFWRDAAVPFLEMRSIEDGRQVCYGRHSTRFSPSVRSPTARAPTAIARSTGLSARALLC